MNYFFEIHNPTTLNAQGPDIGTQYRSGIYFSSAEQESEAMMIKSGYNEVLGKRGINEITTEIARLDKYFYAEDYHQQYLAKNPNGYCGLRGTGVQCQL